MAFETLLFLLVFVIPGAVFLKVWDFLGHKDNRDSLSLLGYGILISSGIYLILSIFHFIDLRWLLNENRNVSLAKILDSRNIQFFLGLTLSLVPIAIILSKIFHSNKMQNWCNKLLGKSTIESSWAEIARYFTNNWIRVRAKNGIVWQGALDKVGPRYDDGFISIKDPEYYDPDKEEWITEELDIIVIKLSDIDHYLTGNSQSDGGKTND